MSAYTEFSDPYRAKNYEQAKRWYEQYKQSCSPSATAKQRSCIYAIRKHNPMAPKFMGSTVDEASKYITEWGGSTNES